MLKFPKALHSVVLIMLRHKVDIALIVDGFGRRPAKHHNNSASAFALIAACRLNQLPDAVVFVVTGRISFPTCRALPPKSLKVDLHTAPPLTLYYWLLGVSYLSLHHPPSSSFLLHPPSDNPFASSSRTTLDISSPQDLLVCSSSYIKPSGKSTFRTRAHTWALQNHHRHQNSSTPTQPPLFGIRCSDRDRQIRPPSPHPAQTSPHHSTTLHHLFFTRRPSSSFDSDRSLLLSPTNTSPSLNIDHYL